MFIRFLWVIMVVTDLGCLIFSSFQTFCLWALPNFQTQFLKDSCILQHALICSVSCVFVSVAASLFYPSIYCFWNFVGSTRYATTQQWSLFMSRIKSVGRQGELRCFKTKSFSKINRYLYCFRYATFAREYTHGIAGTNSRVSKIIGPWQWCDVWYERSSGLSLALFCLPFSLFSPLLLSRFLHPDTRSS